MIELELIALSCAGMLFLILVGVAGMQYRLRRIENKLRVLVPDPPPRPWFATPEPVIVKKRRSSKDDRPDTTPQTP